MNFGSYANLTSLFTAIGTKFLNRPERVNISAADFNNLSTEEKNDPKKIYYIDGLQIIGATIDDATTSADNVWSSQKTQTELNKKVDKEQITNPNLLDNPWFTINQKGATTFTYSNGVDRWRGTTNNLTGNVESDGISFTYDGSATWSELRQVMLEKDAKLLDGKALTLSVLYSDGELHFGTGTYHYSTDGVVISISLEDGKYTFDLYNDSTRSNRLMVRLGTDSSSSYTSKTIRAVKLEVGSISTLGLDTAPNYLDELTKCLYYYEKFTVPNGNYIGTAFCYDAKWLYLDIDMTPKLDGFSVAGSSPMANLRFSKTTLSAGSAPGMYNAVGKIYNNKYRFAFYISTAAVGERWAVYNTNGDHDFSFSVDINA